MVNKKHPETGPSTYQQDEQLPSLPVKMTAISKRESNEISDDLKKMMGVISDLQEETNANPRNEKKKDM